MMGRPAEAASSPSPASRRAVATGLRLYVAMALALAGCGGAAVPTPYVPPTPPPTPVPWTLTVTSMTIDAQAILGDTFAMTVKVKNTGRAANPAVSVQINGLSNHADLAGCRPTCEITNFLGGTWATFPGIAAGKSATYVLSFQTTKLGRIEPFACVQDNAPGELPFIDVKCGSASVVIGG